MQAIETFRHLSELTWDTLNRAYERGIRLGEDAITTYNLLSLDSLLNGAVLVEDTRLEESMKGADFELWVGGASLGWFRYAVQAKRLSKDQRYRNLNHEVKGSRRRQIDILEEYASSHKAAPIYCFYNYSATPVTSNCNINFDTKQLGCMVVPSTTVQAAIELGGRSNFRWMQARREAFPWQCLVGCPLLLYRQSNMLNSGFPNYHEKLPEWVDRMREEGAINYQDRPPSHYYPSSTIIIAL